MANSISPYAAYGFFYNGQQCIEIRNGSGQTVKQQVWGLKYIDELVQQSLNSDYTSNAVCETKYWALCDANYNILGIVDSSGILTERYEYTPYGQRTVFHVEDSESGAWVPTSTGRRTSEPWGLCEFGHQGLMHDEEIELIYNRARELNPVLGRFMQRDPLGYVDGMSLYGNNRFNPINYRDSLGLSPLTPEDKQRLDELLRQLDDEDWKVREQASNELRQWALEDPDLAQLLEGFMRNPATSPEANLRLENSLPRIKSIALIPSVSHPGDAVKLVITFRGGVPNQRLGSPPRPNQQLSPNISVKSSNPEVLNPVPRGDPEGDWVKVRIQAEYIGKLEYPIPVRAVDCGEAELTVEYFTLKTTQTDQPGLETTIIDPFQFLTVKGSVVPNTTTNPNH
jgi:RHS repeat-associated protein